jgi:beta-lactamase class A
MFPAPDLCGGTTQDVSRRSALLMLASALTAACASVRSQPGGQIVAQLRALEARARGKLGVCMYDTHLGGGIGWRENERFAHCSSFKMSLAAMLLQHADNGKVDLNEVLRWTPSDMLGVSPVTAEHIDRGLSVRALAHATLVTSDNTAANVLLRRFGGPAALTAFWRSLGDPVSRLDRYEPELNDRPADSELDTTTPRAMARTTAALVSGSALTVPSRSMLRAWMSEVRTGSQRIRAGFPPEWTSGDKTGTGIGTTRHTYVDIAYGGPDGRAPIVVAAYFEPSQLVEPMDRVALSTLAEVGRIAASSVLHTRSR